jgi:predicted NUDIX family phosphoesterase
MANNELNESVLVVARQVIDELCPQTFGRETEAVRLAILAKGHFLDRKIAEHDFQHKQVIPYVVIRHEDRYLLMRRTSKQTETRLHDKFSLGVGGHINNLDTSDVGCDVIMSGMRRELNEEIQIESEESCELVGIINDDSTEVARVHMGLVFVLTTSSPDYKIMEPDKYTAEWKSAEEMADYQGRMESWAQIVHDNVICDGHQAGKGRIHA